MELLAVGLSGIRRFAEQGPLMDVVGTPIAVVGPNEAGKTTFLRSLEGLNDDAEIPSEELTRGGDGEARIVAHFRLEDLDLTAIAELPLVGTSRTMTVEKREGGGLYVTLEPRLTRDLNLLETTRKAVADFRQSRWARMGSGENEGSPEGTESDSLSPRAALAAIEGLIGEDALLDEQELDRLALLIDTVEAASDLPATGKKLAGRLRDLHERDSAGDPVASARNILFSRRPRFLWFDESWRQLESQFDIVNGPISPAMRALFDLIQFDLDELRQAILAANEPRITELVDEANDGFEALFAGRWCQSRLRARIDRNGEIILVYVRNVGGRLIPIAERSEGLRQFIALLAFVESEAEGENVVLLVDEAENHLHYDAQADLIRMFTEQGVVEKVIYTTHSAACLPTDLGTGIRVIEPCGPADKEPEDWEHSRIRNAFWSSGPGFSPLLMAMGASTFAFSSLRRALIGEGISEVILLPTLFREATGKDHLQFQVAPGISTVRIEDADALDELAATATRVAYLVDGDGGGLALKRRLLQASVPEERIIVLGAGREPLAIEDVIVKEHYLAALNRELAPSGVEMSLATLPDVGRKAAVKRWCRRRRVDAPTEREVAQNLLEIVREARHSGGNKTLLDTSHRDLLNELHQQVEQLLGLARAAVHKIAG
jgi:hypothetical protein